MAAEVEGLMPKFSERSLIQLNTCHPDLVRVFNEVIWYRDCIIIEGYRNEAAQEEMFRTQRSQLRYPHSKHNQLPSMAVDVMEYYPDKPHIRWFNKDANEDFSKFVLVEAANLLDAGEVTHRLRWGADWDMDGIRVDKDDNETFFDGPHYELVEIG